MLKVKKINSYYGGAHILHDVSLNVEQGEVVALLGRNGAGKSTTMKSICGLVQPKSGVVEFMGQGMQGKPPYHICRAGIGYVPEERRVFSELTILENLEVGKRSARQDVPQWSHEKLFELFPNLAERRQNLGSQLSGGEQQMLSIARTLMGNPSFILLDEPSEGLAPVIVEQMALAIMELKKQGVTILLSEQNLHFAKLVADRAVILESGFVRYGGTIVELEADEEVRTAYLMV
jgi:branched-chain amino acid transport system ATP-binding protein